MRLETSEREGLFELHIKATRGWKRAGQGGREGGRKRERWLYDSFAETWR